MSNTQRIKPAKNQGNWFWSLCFLAIAIFVGQTIWKNATVPLGLGNPNGDHIRLTNLETKPILKEGMHLYYLYKTEEEYPEWRLLEVSRLDIWTQGKIRSGKLDHVLVQSSNNNFDKEQHFEALLAEKGQEGVNTNSFDSVAKWQLYQGYLICTVLMLLTFSILMVKASIRQSKKSQANATYLLAQFPDLQGDLQGIVEEAIYADRQNGIYVYRHHLLTHDLTGMVDLTQVRLISGEQYKERLTRHTYVTKFLLKTYGQDLLKPTARFVFYLPGRHGQEGLLGLREYLLSVYPQIADGDFEKVLVDKR